MARMRAARLSKRPGSVWNCLWGNTLKIYSGIIRKSRVSYPGPGFISSATWPSLPKKYYNGLNQTVCTNLHGDSSLPWMCFASFSVDIPGASSRINSSVIVGRISTKLGNFLPVMKSPFSFVIIMHLNTIIKKKIYFRFHLHV